MFTKFAKNIISSNAKTALDVAVELYNKKKYTNLVMVVGSDRVQDFKKLQTYNGEEKKHGFYDFDSIDVVSAGERDPDAEGVERYVCIKDEGSCCGWRFQVISYGHSTISF